MQLPSSCATWRRGMSESPPFNGQIIFWLLHSPIYGLLIILQNHDFVSFFIIRWFCTLWFLGSDIFSVAFSFAHPVNFGVPFSVVRIDSALWFARIAYGFYLWNVVLEAAFSFRSYTIFFLEPCRFHGLGNINHIWLINYPTTYYGTIPMKI